MAKVKRKGKRNKETARLRGLLRQAHFESGGSTREWNGPNAVHDSQKRRNRSTDNRKAIKESLEG